MRAQRNRAMSFWGVIAGFSWLVLLLAQVEIYQRCNVIGTKNCSVHSRGRSRAVSGTEILPPRSDLLHGPNNAARVSWRSTSRKIMHVNLTLGRIMARG